MITAGALMAFQALAIIGAGPAAASATCSFDSATHTVSVTLGGIAVVTMTVDAGTGAIKVNGSACGLATTSNTTQINIQGYLGDERVAIDNRSGAPFPSSISWQVALHRGWLTIYLADGANGSVSVTDSGFTMNGATGLFSGVTPVRVYGGAGNDTINGSALSASGPGFYVEGGAGNDTISGGAGNDWMAGGYGDDTISGGAGNDSVDGGTGDDVVDEGAAASGKDTLAGGAGEDTIDYGARSTSTIVNNDGTASSGEDANGDGDAEDPGDEQDAVSGFEVIMTGSGDDTLNGDPGTDETFAPGPGDDTVDGNGGSDTLDLSSSTAPVTVDAPGGTAEGQGSDTFTDVTSFVGSDHADTFVSDAGGWTFDGGAGVDTVDYSGTTGGVTADLSGLGPSDDHLLHIENAIGGSGNDTITGSSSRNSIRGGGGDDTLNGGAGNDTLDGGAGDDFISGDAGVDLASYAGESGAVEVDLSFGTASSPDGDDTLVSVEGVLGSTFADSISGDGSSNLLVGGAGADFIRAGGGDDTVEGGAGGDTLIGGSGDDSLHGGAGGDSLYGGSGDDSLYGGAGDDALSGGSGTDFGNGGKGADVCTGVEIRKSC